MTLLEAIKKLNRGKSRGAAANLARLSGLSKGYVSSLINGRQQPKEDAIDRLTEAFKPLGLRQKEVAAMFVTPKKNLDWAVHDGGDTQAVLERAYSELQQRVLQLERDMKLIKGAIGKGG